MRIQERQPAFLTPFHERFVVHFSHFFLINDFEAGEINPLVARNIDLGLAINQQTAFGQGLAELNSLLSRRVIGLAKLKSVIGQFARLALGVKKLLIDRPKIRRS